MKSSSSIVLILSISLLWISCVKDEPDNKEGSAKVILTFDPRHNDQDLQFGERFTNVDNYPVELTAMKFYLSNILLLNSGGDTVKLSDVEFLDIRNNLRSLEFSVPSGDYSSIHFDLGVPTSLNGTENANFLVSLYDNDHPLSTSNGMYWVWQSGYRFFFLEGRCDTVQVAEEVLPLTFGLHSGRDTLFRSLPDFELNLRALKDNNYIIPFAIDVEKVFMNGDTHIDLKYERQFHGSFSEIPLGIKLADNTAAAFRLVN